MSYGQYTGPKRQVIDGQDYALMSEKDAARRGYPSTAVKVGSMTRDEIMSGVERHTRDIVSTKKTAHNEVTRIYTDGTVVCRLRETDIVTIYPHGPIDINTGGWNTRTTRRHIVDFLERHNFPVTIWGDKKRGGNVLTLTRGDVTSEIVFEQTVIIFTDGTWVADWDGGPK